MDVLIDKNIESNLNSPHQSPLPKLIIELVKQKDSHYYCVYYDLYHQGPDHLLSVGITILLFMNSLDVQVEVFVLQLKAQHKERSSEVPELHQFSKAQIAKTCPYPQDKLHQLQLTVDDELKDEVEGKGIDKAQKILGIGVFEDIAIDVESVMSIIVSNERVNQGKLVHQDDGKRQQEHIGCKGMSRDVDPLEEYTKRRNILSECDWQVYYAENSKIQQLIWMESQMMMRVITKHKPSAVIDSNIDKESCNCQQRELILVQDLFFVGKDYLDYGQEMRRQGLRSLNELFVFTKHLINDQIEYPYDVILANQDRSKGYQSQTPFTLYQVVVEHCCQARNTRAVGVIQKIEEVDCWSEGEVQRSGQIGMAWLYKVIYFENIYKEDV